MNKILILLGLCALFGAGCKITRQGYQFIITSGDGGQIVEGTQLNTGLQSNLVPSLSITPDSGFPSGSFVLPTP
ncbi:MAG: hypothetical protein WC551_06270 [Patescibacteria group bacterium]